ncbi:MAG: ABC transporter substrate-binding protein [Nitrososphaerota archaeon]
MRDSTCRRGPDSDYSISRRKAISKVAATLVATAFAAGVGGYYIGASTGSQRLQTEARTVTVQKISTVTMTPARQPVTISFTNTQGMRGASPPSLVIENVKEIREMLKVDLKYNIVRGAGEALKELADGRADVVAVTPALNAFQAFETNPELKIKIVYFADISDTSGFIVGANSPFNSLEDIKRDIQQGRKIKVGISRPGSKVHLLSYVLAHVLGTKIGEGIEVVALGEVDAIVAALTRGEIDGFPWSLDTLWRLEEENKGKVIYYFSEYFGPQWHERTFVTTEEVIAKNPEIVGRFIELWREAIRYYQLHREKVITLMASPPPVGIGTTPTIAKRYTGVYQPNYVGAPLMEAIDNAVKIGSAIGLLKRSPPIDQLYTTRFL